MKPLFLHYSGGQSSTWTKFAKKKLKALSDRLEFVGLTTGRQELKFGNVEIGLLVTAHFNRIRISTSGATFFVKFQYLETPSLNVYESIAAYDDNGNRQWVVHFDPFPLTSLMSRTLLGCSSDGSKVLVVETDISTYLRVRTISGGTINDGYEFDLNAANLDITSVSGKVSVNGSRALIGKARLMASPTVVDDYVVFYYDAELADPIQAMHVDAQNVDTVYFGGASDLSTAYVCMGNTTRTTATTHAIPYTKAVRDESGLTITSNTLATPIETAYQCYVNEIAFSPEGSMAISYVTITPGTASIFDPVTLTARVQGLTGTPVTLATETTDYSSSGASGSTGRVQLWNLQNDDFLYYLTPYSLGSWTEVDGDPLFDHTSGKYIDGALSTASTGEIFVALSPDSENTVVRKATTYTVQSADGEFTLPGDTHALGTGSYSAHAIIDVGTVFSVMEPGVQGAVSYRKWVTQEEDGVVVSYADAVTLGSNPSSLTRTLDEDPPRDITLSRSQTVSVYPQQVM